MCGAIRFKKVILAGDREIAMMSPTCSMAGARATGKI
jgi:hypothetical protein